MARKLAPSLVWAPAGGGLGAGRGVEGTPGRPGALFGYPEASTLIVHAVYQGGLRRTDQSKKNKNKTMSHKKIRTEACYDSSIP